MARDLNFVVVGLGMGGHHCKAIRDAKGAHLAGVCDIDPKRLKQRMKEFDCRDYATFDEVLKDPAVDVVSIVTESGYHTAMGAKAARAGKHIIMEKPVDINPARIRKFEEVIQAAGVKCGCIFQSRMENCNILIRKAIQKGQMGQIIGAHAHLPWFRGDAYFQGPHGPWRGTWNLDGGGSMMNQGIHTIDLIQWLAGPVESVCGFYGVHNHKIEAEDQAVACLKFANGALGTFYSTTCCIPEGAQRIYMYGTKGSFQKYGNNLESYDMGPEKERKRMMALFSGKKEVDAIGKDPMAVSADGHLLIVEDLVKAIRLDREPVIPVSSARHAVEIACAIYKSAQTGKTVRVTS